ncbi:hypothetical protein BDW75DRAFT_238223 [Aspergillus navahoensis]
MADTSPTSTTLVKFSTIKASMFRNSGIRRDCRGADVNATTIVGLNYVERAASEGVNLVAFPELCFPGYPHGTNATWKKEMGQSNTSKTAITRDGMYPSPLQIAMPATCTGVLRVRSQLHLHGADAHQS